MDTIPRWYPVDVQQTFTAVGVDVVLTTDVPCHLWLFYTFQEPWIHPITGRQRGLGVPWYAYWCYVTWIVVEQEEAGDTTEHTFIITGLVTCNKIWYRFHGNIGGVSSPSDSPIIYKHYVKPELPATIDWPLGDPYIYGPDARWNCQCYEYPIDGTPTSIELWLIGNKTPDVDIIFYIEECFYEPIPDVWQPYSDQTGHILDQVTIPKGDIGRTDAVPYKRLIPFPNPPNQAAGTGIAVTMYNNYNRSPGLWHMGNEDYGSNKFRRYVSPPAGVFRPWVGVIPLNIPWASTVIFTP